MWSHFLDSTGGNAYEYRDTENHENKWVVYTKLKCSDTCINYVNPILEKDMKESVTCDLSG